MNLGFFRKVFLLFVVKEESNEVYKSFFNCFYGYAALFHEFMGTAAGHNGKSAIFSVECPAKWKYYGYA
jgi:hypothetical protein